MKFQMERSVHENGALIMLLQECLLVTEIQKEGCGMHLNVR